MSFHAHTIPQIDQSVNGIHLIWIGPRQWRYSPGGWDIQRRVFNKDRRMDCIQVQSPDLIKLKEENELFTAHGVLAYRRGIWPRDIANLPVSGEEKKDLPAEVFTLNFNQPHSFVRVEVLAKGSFVYAMRDGKVVATGGNQATGLAHFELNALMIDTVVVYAFGTERLGFCVELEREEDEWDNIPYIVKGMQLPLLELNPNINSLAEEYQEAQSRLLPGETLDPLEFARLMNTLREGLIKGTYPRPIDKVMLMRENLTSRFEELLSLDPLKIMLSSPKWRRVLGFSFFDGDPALVQGNFYQYRITGYFPAGDLADQVYGFHTIPSKTLLPAHFFLDDIYVRISRPTTVELAMGTPDSGLLQVSRRGIELRPENKSLWELLPFDNWSIAITLSSAVDSVILELHEFHDLEYSWGFEWQVLNGPLAVPPGTQVRIDFPSPSKHLRLRGKGFLFALRIPKGQIGIQPYSGQLPPVQFENTPLPNPPLFAGITNLQQLTPIQDAIIPSNTIPYPHSLGFKITWRPALINGLSQWPVDSVEAPPLEAMLYQIEHRQDPGAEWHPLLTEENWLLGERNQTKKDARIFPGSNLLQIFPEVSKRNPDAGLDKFWKDVFDFAEGGREVVRPLPKPGTFHQYRIRTIDPIGRPSTDWTLSNVLRLEKHKAPPTPVGIDETPADQLGLPAPTGVHARILVKNAPDLTADELVILGNHENVIILKWGWHQQQRDQDTFAKEFRVYLAEKPLDYAQANLTGFVQQNPGIYDVNLVLDREVVQDSAKGSFLQAGYPFYIESHSGGSAISARLITAVQKPDGTYHEPQSGEVLFPIQFGPRLTRPPAWSQRLNPVVPITDEEVYEQKFFDALTLSPDHPRDVVWVGVSAADDQAYVPDQLFPNENRPGNESAIVPVVCEAKYYGIPAFTPPLEIAEVDVIPTPEPTGRPLSFELDLSPYLTFTGLSPGNLVRPERVAADEVFAAYYYDADSDKIMARVIQRKNDLETDVEVNIDHPADHTEISTALGQARTDLLENRYVVYLAGAHPYRDRLFTPVSQEPLAFGVFKETLTFNSGRFVYRLRKSDASRNLSVEGAVARAIVRIPSLNPGAPPERLPVENGDAPGLVRMEIAPDRELIAVLFFTQDATGAQTGPIGESELMRVPNKPDLYPDTGIMMRAPDGALLFPVVKRLDEPDIVVTPDGYRRLGMDLSTDPGKSVRVWACTVTIDGIPSRLAGPWTFRMNPVPLAVPTLSISGSVSDLVFNWTWPDQRREMTSLERSEDGIKWKRISPMFNNSLLSFSYKERAGSANYRLKIISLDGRTAESNSVQP